ncbi:MAG: hypothetical protein ACT4QF_04625 [Sporichthyaceae bacterium]
MFLASPSPTPVPIDASKVEAGWIGLTFFAVSVLLLALLGWSMSARVRRVQAARAPGGWAAPRLPVTPQEASRADSGPGAIRKDAGDVQRLE